MGGGLLPSRVFVVVILSHGHGRRACRVCRLGSRVDHRFLSAIASLGTSERDDFRRIAQELERLSRETSRRVGTPLHPSSI
jgi:hypothetical protein